MSFEGDEGGAGGGVPQPRGVVIGGGEDLLSVPAENYRAFVPVVLKEI